MYRNAYIETSVFHLVQYVYIFWMCKTVGDASTMLLRERKWTYGLRISKSSNANTYFSGDNICVAAAADFRCDWAVGAMRTNSNTASVTNCSVTSVSCVSVGSLLHTVTAALLSLRGGPLRHVASHSLLYSPMQSLFLFCVLQPVNMQLALLPFWCYCRFHAAFSARWNVS